MKDSNQGNQAKKGKTSRTTRKNKTNLFEDGMILFIEYSMESVKKLFELKNKINIQKSILQLTLE